MLLETFFSHLMQNVVAEICPQMITQKNRTISKPLAPSKTKSAEKSEYERSVCAKEEPFLNILY